MTNEEKQRIRQLEEHSYLLGVISMHLEDFIQNPEESVVTTLLRMITNYRYHQYEQAQTKLDQSIIKDIQIEHCDKPTT